jgi:hypothetical protein
MNLFPSWLRFKGWREAERVLTYALCACTAGVALAFLVRMMANTAMDVESLRKLLRVTLFTLFVASAYVSAHIWVSDRRLRRLERSHDWLLSTVNWNMERLRAHGLISSDKQTDAVATAGTRWPWGSHHTEFLGHLEAAARRFWTLYDPADPSTAPTNEMVADWLQKERDVSKDKSRAIASILRPDRLPTGPRR